MQNLLILCPEIIERLSLYWRKQKGYHYHNLCLLVRDSIIVVMDSQNNFFRMFEISESQFAKIIEELNLKVRDDNADREEIKYILTEILGYPLLEKALEHHKANKLGTNDLLQKQKQIQQRLREKSLINLQICSCCGMLLENDELPYSTKFKELNLGIGVHLFFKDFLYYAFIFALIFFVYSIYSISTNSISFSSDQTTKPILCNGTQDCGFSQIGAGSKVLNQTDSKNTMSLVQSWIGVAVVILWGILNIIKTHLQEKEIVDIETKRTSASDFTLMITNVPRIHLGETQEESLQLIKNIFNQYYENEKSKRACIYPYEVVSVNIAKHLYMENRRNSQYKDRVKSELHDRQNVFRNWIIYRKEHERFPFDYNARCRVYEDYHNYYSGIFEKEIFPKIPLEEKNTIFVTMRYSKARQQIQKNNAPISIFKFWKFFKDSDFPIQGVEIKKAPEPEQIKWNNIGFPDGERTFRRFMAWLATIALLGISLGISIGISYVKKDVAVSIGISIVVTLINVGIQVLLVYFTSLEYQIIESWEQSSIAWKIGISQLINSICVPIIATAISQSQQTPKPWLKAGGLSDDVFFIALLNLFVPISTLIDPYEHLLRFIRWWKDDPLTRLQMFGQKQLNKYYGNYQFDIGYEYVFLIKTTIFTAFFVSMQPIIALFAPFALIFYYFSVKRNLLYHYQRPNYHFQTTNNTVDLLLLFSLLAFGLGSLFVNSVPEVTEINGTFPSNLIMILVACGFLIVVPFRFFYCCISKPDIENKDYLKKKMLIYTDYDRVNPITKNSAITEFEKYMKGLEDEKGLPDEYQLVKLHVSTIQIRETMKPENKLRQSFSRLSVSFMRQPSNEPQYNHDLQYYQQIANQKSVHFKRTDSSRQDQEKLEHTVDRLEPLSKISENKNEHDESNYK